MGRAKESKVQAINNLLGLLDEYRTLVIAELHKVRSGQLQELRKALEGKAIIRVIRGTLFRKAITMYKGRKENLRALEKHLRGQNFFIFAQMDPFEVASFLRKMKMVAPAKAGDIAPSDIVVPAGNTGLPAGPIISELTDIGLPVKIDMGTVVVTRDTVVARKGETISSALASVLSKLGMKPIELSILPKVAYGEGIVAPRDLLQIDEEAVRYDLQDAIANALKLAFGVPILMEQTIPGFILRASVESLFLALYLAYPTSQTIEELLKRAYLSCMLVKSAVESS